MMFVPDPTYGQPYVAVGPHASSPRPGHREAREHPSGRRARRRKVRTPPWSARTPTFLVGERPAMPLTRSLVRRDARLEAAADMQALPRPESNQRQQVQEARRRRDRWCSTRRDSAAKSKVLRKPCARWCLAAARRLVGSAAVSSVEGRRAQTKPDAQALIDSPRPLSESARRPAVASTYGLRSCSCARWSGVMTSRVVMRSAYAVRTASRRWTAMTSSM